MEIAWEEQAVALEQANVSEIQENVGAKIMKIAHQKPNIVAV